jgi:DNA (cytosine-5)-methyltransferase 1
MRNDGSGSDTHARTSCRRIELRRIGSLYSGIAGLELGVLAAFVEAGLPARIAWQCEIDPFCTRVLAHHFPDVPRYSDVATVSYPPAVDVLCGGFACQDVSSAGKGAGLGKETRSGFTLHHLLRIIDEIEPRFLAIENVASGAKRWLPRVVQELVDRGYRPRAVPLGAVDVGAPHRRLRVFVVADRASDGRQQGGTVAGGCGGGVRADESGPSGGGRGEPLADRDGSASRGLGAVRDGERAALGDDAGERREGLVADGQRSGLEVERVEQARRQLAPAERGGGVVGDAAGSRCGRCEDAGADRRDAGAGEATQGRGAALDLEPERDGRVADSAEPGRTGTDGGERQGRPVESERRGDAWSNGRSPQPGLGGDAHGLPFDVARHTFPAGRGAEQYPWEAPRAIGGDVKVPDRPAQLRALGNAVVPQCGLVVGRILVAMGA